jgi:3-dehydroquinate synthase class II
VSTCVPLYSSECLQAEGYVNSRPFRVNAGPLWWGLYKLNPRLAGFLQVLPMA